MNLTFAPQAWEDYHYWRENSSRVVERIHELIKDVLRHAYQGIGKLELLKHAMRGYWSRRITAEHRMVYKVVEGAELIAQLRYHY